MTFWAVSYPRCQILRYLTIRILKISSVIKFLANLENGRLVDRVRLVRAIGREIAGASAPCEDRAPRRGQGGETEDKFKYRYGPVRPDRTQTFLQGGDSVCDNVAGHTHEHHRRSLEEANAGRVER